MPRKLVRILVLSFITALPVCLSAGAEQAWAEYPDHSITAVVPFAAGSSNDTVARVIAPRLAQALGQPIVVEDKPGADAVIGVQVVANAPADGYTILFSAGAVELIPALHRNPGYDPVRQIAGVAEVGGSPYIIAASSKLPIDNLTSLLDYAKKNAGKLNMPSSGNTSRVSAEQFKLSTGLDITIVPYNGTGEALTSLMTGETDLALLDSLTFKSIAGNDKVRVLAVASKQRTNMFPTLPTAAEAGLPNYTADAYFGVFITGGSPPAVIARLNTEINKILADPEVVKAMAALGVEISPMNADDFEKRYLADMATWKDVVTKAHITPTN